MASGTKTPERNEHGEEVQKPLFPIENTPGAQKEDQQFGPSTDARYERMRELQQLEKQAGLDNSGYNPDNPASKSESRSSLDEKEATAATPLSGSLAGSDGKLNTTTGGGKIGGDGGMWKGKEGAASGKLADKFSLSGSFKNMAKRKVAAIAVTTILAGGGIFGAGILSGPFQFVQLAKMLEGFHLDTNQKNSDVRFIKTIRYINATRNGNVEKTRLGYFGNKVADKVEKNMQEKAGVTSEYKDGRARYKIDMGKLAGTQYDSFKDKTPAELKAHIERTNPGVPIESDGKNLTIKFDGLSYRQETRMIKTFMKPSGYSKVSSSVAFRIVAKRHGATLHPIKKLDRKIEQSAQERYKQWRKDRAARINNGDTISGRNPQSSDPENPTTADAEVSEEIANEADEARDGIAEGDTESSDKFRDSLNGKATLGTIAGLGILCTLRDVDKQADGIKTAKVILPMIRMFTEVVAVGNQGMSGNDITLEQMGFYSKQLYGADSRTGKNPKTGNKDVYKSGWNEAESFRAEQGKEGGVEARETVKTAGKSGSPFSFTNTGTLGGALGPACSAPAQIGLGIGSALLGGGVVSSAISAGAGFVLGPIVMKEAANWLAGNAIDPFAAGADFGNIANTGGRMMANSQMISSGGRELNDEEEADIDNSVAQAEKEDFEQESLATRMFDVNSTHSLASQVAVTGMASIESGVMKSITNPISSFGSSWFTQKLFSSTASAAVGRPIDNPRVNYDYGFKQYGFSKAEMTDQRWENPYANADVVTDQIMPSKTCEDCYENNEFSDRARECFGVHLTAAGDIESFNEYDGEAPNPTKLPEKCSDPSEDWQRTRMYIFDTQTMAGGACFEGEDEACTLVNANEGGGGGAAVSDAGGTEVAGEKVDVSKLGYSSDKIQCAEGTKDLGVVTSKYTGSIKKQSGPLKIRLCEVTDIPGNGIGPKGEPTSGGAVVDASVSGAWAGLAKAAKAENIPLNAGSSFRLEDSCKGTGDGTACARPGKSFHQTGYAIDFGNGMYPNKGTSTTSCSGRARLPDNKSWKWLEQNADKWGMEQYSFESWHWDPSGGANRCGKGE